MEWPSNFEQAEFDCKCDCGFGEIDQQLVIELQLFRDLLWICSGREHSVVVTSGCRCKQHNYDVGGVPHSYHVTGKAVDVVVSSMPAMVMARMVLVGKNLERFKAINGIGAYPGDYRLHLDVRQGPLVTWIKKGRDYTYGVDFTGGLRG